jgi:hypothetical protein
MIGLASIFTEEELEFMKNSIGLELSDTKDYSEDELMDIYEKICDELPMDFWPDGTPKRTGWLFESIVDKFYDI